MRWKVKSKPKIGNTRNVIKFAWLPVRANDPNYRSYNQGYIVWLETYIQEQIYLAREESYYRNRKKDHWKIGKNWIR